MMTLEEICALIEQGAEMNPLEWTTEDRYKYCIITLAAMTDKLEHLAREHLHADQDGLEGMFVDDEDAECAFAGFDQVMFMGHVVHTLLQSVLTVEVRERLLKAKVELITGIPVKDAKWLGGNVVAFSEDNSWVPDNVEGADDGDA